MSDQAELTEGQWSLPRFPHPLLPAMAGLLGPPWWAEDLPGWAEGPPSVLGRDVLGTSGCCRCKFPVFIWFQVSSGFSTARTLRWGGLPLSTLLPLPVGPPRMGLLHGEDREEGRREQEQPQAARWVPGTGLCSAPPLPEVSSCPAPPPSGSLLLCS